MKVLFIYGTRPEAIKMAPLIKKFREYSNKNIIEVCLTGQHREMLDQVNAFFGIVGDYDLSIMEPNQTLFDITTRCLSRLEKIFADSQPDIVIVQGDTTSAMVGALAAFYKKIAVIHLEAGLRSGSKYSPFPEEVNRKIIATISDYHFAPTIMAARNLGQEGITQNVHVVGNTAIDALLLGLEILKKDDGSQLEKDFAHIDFSKRLILITAHRRESFGEGILNICRALRQIALSHQEIEIVFPVHFNPNIREPAKKNLSGLPNVHLLDPLDYPTLIQMMNKSFLVMTDSGGIQEEAPSLGKPVLVLREVSERMEGVEAGTARIIGTDYNSIIAHVENLLDNEAEYEKMAKAINPYGDGNTSERIVEIVLSHSSDSRRLETQYDAAK
jgi:UDP-N-acetylglucosamine 2-epimerase (non-hydrolysing)